MAPRGAHDTLGASSAKRGTAPMPHALLLMPQVISTHPAAQPTRHSALGTRHSPHATLRPMSIPSLRPLLLLCPLALPLAAQQPAETLTIDYIEVPVTVVDRTGNPVRNLTKANFEVYDNKARVNVTSFETVDFSSKEGIKLAAATPAAKRSFLLLFDLGYSSPASLGRAQNAARAFVGNTVKAGDLVAV